MDYGEARCVVEKQTAKKHARKMKQRAAEGGSPAADATAATAAAGATAEA